MKRQSAQWDMTVYDAHNRLTVIVEAKKKVGVSKKWAVGLFDNLLADGLLFDAPYFMLALPDQFFIWHRNEANHFDSEHPVQIDARLLLAPYFDQTHTQPEQISPQGFEMIISLWFNELLAGSDRLNQPVSQQLGFGDAIKDGQLTFAAYA